jgi:hypothetical protein
MDLISIITAPGFITQLLGVMFTLLILSYVVGDNPGFRLAVHAFIGISAGYVTAIVLLQVIANKILMPLFLGQMPEQILAGIALVLGLFLLAKLFSRTEWIARPIVAFLVGTGAAAAVAGAMLGTMYPQTIASIDMFSQDALQDPSQGALKGAIILFGTVATLAYFQFTLLGKSAPGGKRGLVMSIIAFLGQIFIAITLGALFAGAFSAALTALIDRIHSIVLFIDQFLH